MVYEGKENVKFITPTYPIKIKNYSTKERVCNNKEELWEHMVEDTNTSIPVITRIVPIHPQHFIDDDLINIVSQFVRFKTYGISYLYPTWDDIPNPVQEAFDYMNAELSKHEQKMIKKASSSEKITKPTDGNKITKARNR